MDPKAPPPPWQMTTTDPSLAWNTRRRGCFHPQHHNTTANPSLTWNVRWRNCFPIFWPTTPPPSHRPLPHLERETEGPFFLFLTHNTTTRTTDQGRWRQPLQHENRDGWTTTHDQHSDGSRAWQDDNRDGWTMTHYQHSGSSEHNKNGKHRGGYTGSAGWYDEHKKWAKGCVNVSWAIGKVFSCFFFFFFFLLLTNFLDTNYWQWPTAAVTTTGA